MNKGIKLMTGLTALAFSIQLSSLSNATTSTSSTTFAAPTSSTPLSPAKCANLEIKLQEFEALVTKYFPKQAPDAIADAVATYNKLCPASITSTPYECNVLNSATTSSTPLGVNSTGGLDNNPATTTKIVCMSQNACANIVSEAFDVLSSTTTTACATAGNTTVTHLTDAQVQTAVNAILNP